MAQEKAYETKIKKFIENAGGWQVKFFANRMTKVGIPDLLCCINGYFVGVEVKAQNGRPSELQLYNIQKIREAGGFAFVLYPSGFDAFKKFINGLMTDNYSRDMPVILK